MRVCADHLRAVLLADGQLPSNAKAGYVIRRILRRAVRYAYTFLGQKQAFMYKLVNVLVEQMGVAFALPAQQELITRVMKRKRIHSSAHWRRVSTSQWRYGRAQGSWRDSARRRKRISVSSIHMVSLSTSQSLSAVSGDTVDAAGFDEEMKKQKERARNAAAVENGDWEVLKEGDQNFVGYDYTEYKYHILRYRKVNSEEELFYSSYSTTLHPMVRWVGRLAPTRVYSLARTRPSRLSTPSARTTKHPHRKGVAKGCKR